MRTLFHAGLLFFSYLLQFHLYYSFAWAPDLVLGTLVVLAFFTGFYELAIWTAFAVWIFNWMPGVPLGLFIFGAIPLCVWLLRRNFPWQLPVTVGVVSAVATVVFYAGTLRSDLPPLWPFLGTLAANILWGQFVLFLSYYGLGYKPMLAKYTRFN